MKTKHEHISLKQAGVIARLVFIPIS